MSILLDALKKSEAQRRLGEVPTLQTNDSPDGRLGDERRPWIAFALILVSAAIMSWTGIEQFGGVDSAPVSREQANDSPAKDIAAPAPEATPPSAVAAAPRARPAGNRAGSRNAAKTPVQDYAAAEDPPEKRNASSRPVAHVEVEKEPSAQPAVDSTPDTAGRAATGAAVVSDQGAYSPQTISYWQVPQRVREELGEFRISVLVYAQNPADRFLLLNGSRMREQDKAEGGAVLEEIQRDRAVFSYRNYRFHIKR